VTCAWFYSSQLHQLSQPDGLCKNVCWFKINMWPSVTTKLIIREQQPKGKCCPCHTGCQPFIAELFQKTFSRHNTLEIKTQVKMSLTSLLWFHQGISLIEKQPKNSVKCVNRGSWMNKILHFYHKVLIFQTMRNHIIQYLQDPWVLYLFSGFSRWWEPYIAVGSQGNSCNK
jgi:hypothetical protein